MTFRPSRVQALKHQSGLNNFNSLVFWFNGAFSLKLPPSAGLIERQGQRVAQPSIQVKECHTTVSVKARTVTYCTANLKRHLYLTTRDLANKQCAELNLWAGFESPETHGAFIYPVLQVLNLRKHAFSTFKHTHPHTHAPTPFHTHGLFASY